jgi:X-X-X-Leu-X-X-Gly heptad repeat protein
MASTIPPILIQLQADVSQLKAGLAQAEKAIKGVDSSVTQASSGMSSFVTNLKRVGATVGIAFGVQQVVAFTKSVFAAAAEAEGQQARLARLLQVSVGASQEQIEVLNQQAAALEQLGVVTEGSITQTQSQLATFNLQTSTIKTLTPAILDYVTAEKGANASAMEFKQATNGLAQALNGNFTSLTRVGFVLDENTKKQISSGTEAERAAAIVSVLDSTYKGFNKSLRDTPAGRTQVLANEFNRLKEELGKALMPALGALQSLLGNYLIPSIRSLAKYFKENGTAIKIYVGIVMSLVAAFYAYRASLIAIKATQAAFLIMQTLMRGATLASIASTNGLAASILVLNAVMKKNPIGLIVFGLIALGAAFVATWKKSETFRGVVIKGIQVILFYWSKLIEGVGKFFSLLGKIPGMGWAKGIADGATDAANKIGKVSDGLNKLKDIKVETDKPKKKTKDKITPGLGDDTKTKEEIAAAKERAAKIFDAESGRLEAQIKAHIDYQEKVADLQKNYAEALASAEETAAEKRVAANETYAEAVANAQKDHTKQMVDIAKDYAKKTADIEAANQKKLTELRTTAAQKAVDLRKSASEKEVSIIQQSVDRLRNAFASGTSFSLTEAFKGKTSGGLLSQMKKQLDDAKKLQEAAAYLAGQGYAQTFIEQVVKAGPEVGLQMVDELKKSSPEQQAEIQKTFMDLESIQDTGLDTLAKSMSNGANLATSELRQAYDQVAIDLKNSLAQVDKELQESLAVQNAEYAMAMAEAKIERDTRMLEAATQLQEAIATAKANLDKALADVEATLAKSRAEAQKKLSEGLAEAQKVLQKALVDAQIAFQKAIDDISSSTAAKLKALQGQLAAVAAATASLQTATSSYTSAASFSTTNPLSTTGSFNSSGGVGTTSYGPTIITNISGTNLTNPSTVASTAVSAIKYGTAVTVNTTSLAGIAAASAPKPTTAYSLSAALRDR